jgi:hypothetical protein
MTQQEKDRKFIKFYKIYWLITAIISLTCFGYLFWMIFDA